MTVYCMNNITECETWPSNLRYIRGIEQKEVVMGLSRRRRTRPTISNEAIAVGSFGKGVIAFQLARAAWDIIDNPVVETTVNRSVIVRHKQRKALRACWHIRPVQLRRDIGAGTAELIDLLLCRERSPVVEVGTGDGKGV